MASKRECRVAGVVEARVLGPGEVEVVTKMSRLEDGLASNWKEEIC